MAFGAKSIVHNTRRAWAGLSWLALRVNRRAQSRLTVLKRRTLGAPELPRAKDGRVRVHLGCGSVEIPDFVNVDAWPAAHVHFVHDVTRLPMFPDGTADLIYACHVFEHIPPARHIEVLWEWRRALKRGGVLRLSVPDFDKLLLIYAECGRDVTSIRNPLLGDEGHNRHEAIVNQPYLQEVLKRAGFSESRLWDPELVEHGAYPDWSSRTIERAGKPWPISLNIEAVKEG